ncbi:MAG: hypothetical protein Q4F00_00495 [bacterium]|nr:hypothetical protein [bacterium]
MQDHRPTQLTQAQIISCALLALGLSSVGWWFGGVTSAKPPQPAVSASPTPVDRRTAEGDAKQAAKRTSSDLTYHENTADFSHRRLGYIPPRLYSKQRTNGSSPDKPIQITVDLVPPANHAGQPPHRSKTSAVHSPAAASPAAAKASDVKATHTKKSPKANTSSRLASRPAPQTSQLTSSAGLKYPPANITAKVGLTAAWRGISDSITYVYDSTNTKAIGLHCPIASDLSVCSSALTKEQKGNANLPIFLNLDKLHLTLSSSKNSRLPGLASSPPVKNEYLAAAAPASNPNAFATAKVTKALYGGMFSLICPINVHFGGSPLLNDHGELTGIVAGTIPAYRGHNHFVGLDSSLIYAWSQHSTKAGQQSLYDLNFQVCDQLERNLARFDKQRAERLAKKHENQAIPGKALGNYLLGSTSAEITAALGEGTANGQDLLGHELGSSDPMFQYVLYPDRGLAFNYYDGRLVAIETNNAIYKTPKGLGVGLSPSQGSHEFSRHKCTGYTDSEHTLMVIQGLEIELNNLGLIELIRVTI